MSCLETRHVLSGDTTQDMSCLETEDMSDLETQKMGHPLDTHLWVTHLTQNIIIFDIFAHVWNHFGSIGDMFGHRFGILLAMFWGPIFV